MRINPNIDLRRILSIQPIIIALTVLLVDRATPTLSSDFSASAANDRLINSNPLDNNWIQDDSSWNYWWTYTGVSGPDYWGLLNPDWYMCAKGRRQSPIDIRTQALVYDPRMQPLSADKNLISGVLYNDGHAIVFSSSITASTLMLMQKQQNSNISSNYDAKDQDNNENKHIASLQQLNGATTAGGTSIPSFRKSSSIDLPVVEGDRNGASNELLIDNAVPGGHLRRPKRSVADTLIDAGANDPDSSSVDGERTAELAPASMAVQLEKLSNSVEMSIGQADRLAFVSNDDDISSNNNKNDNDDRREQQQQQPQQLPELDEENLSPHSNAVAQSQAERPGVVFTGADLAYQYKFEAFYMRFGSQQRTGSEHRINSHGYSGELQIIAYNSHLYKSYSQAVDRPNGLMAIAILVDVALPANKSTVLSASTQDNTVPPSTPTPLQTLTSAQTQTPAPTAPASASASTGSSAVVMPNAHLEQVLSQLDKLKHRTSMVSIEALNVSALLSDSDQFVAYDGSLTVPGCYESVHWLVLNRPLYISQQSMDKLRLISADEPSTDGSQSGTMLADNVRPVQPSNGRVVRTNIRPQYNQAKPETCQRLWTSYSYRRSKKATTI